MNLGGATQICRQYFEGVRRVCRHKTRLDCQKSSSPLFVHKFTFYFRADHSAPKNSYYSDQRPKQTPMVSADLTSCPSGSTNFCLAQQTENGTATISGVLRAAMCPNFPCAIKSQLKSD